MDLLASSTNMIGQGHGDAMPDRINGQFVVDVKHHRALAIKGQCLTVKLLVALDQVGLAMNI